MTTTTEDWKECNLHLAEYKLQKLPRGDEFSHQDFQAYHYQHKRRGYSPVKTEDELRQEALDQLVVKEKKIMQSLVEE